MAVFAEFLIFFDIFLKTKHTYKRNVQLRRRNTSRNGGEHCSNGA